MRVNYRAILCFILLMIGYQDVAWGMDPHENCCPEESANNIRTSLRFAGCELMEHASQVRLQAFEMQSPLGSLKKRTSEQWEAILKDRETEGKEGYWLLHLEQQTVISSSDRENIHKFYAPYCQKWAASKDDAFFHSIGFLRGFLGKDVDEDDYELADMYFPFLFEEWQQFRSSHEASLQELLGGVISILSSSEARHELVMRSYVVFFKLWTDSLMHKGKSGSISLSDLPEDIRGEMTADALSQAVLEVETAYLSARALTFLECRSTVEKCRELSYNLGFTNSADFFDALGHHLQLPLQEIETVHEFFRRSIKRDQEEGIPSLRITHFNTMMSTMRTHLERVTILFQERNTALPEGEESRSLFSLAAFQRALSCDIGPAALDVNEFALYRESLHNFRQFVWTLIEKNILEGKEDVGLDTYWVWFQNEQTRIHISRLREMIAFLEQEVAVKEQEIEKKRKDVQTLLERKARSEEKRKKELSRASSSLQKKKVSQENDREKIIAELKENLRKAQEEICALEKELEDFKRHQLDFEQNVKDRLLKTKTQANDAEKVAFQQRQDELEEGHKKKKKELTTSSETLSQQVTELEQRLQAEKQAQENKILSFLRGQFESFEGLSRIASLNGFKAHIQSLVDTHHQNMKDISLLSSQLTQGREALQVAQGKAQESVRLISEVHDRNGRERKEQDVRDEYLNRAIQEAQEEITSLSRDLQDEEANIRAAQARETRGLSYSAEIIARYQSQVSSFTLKLQSLQHQLMSYQNQQALVPAYSAPMMSMISARPLNPVLSGPPSYPLMRGAVGAVYQQDDYGRGSGGSYVRKEDGKTLSHRGHPASRSYPPS